jgi:hypothetical protein
MREWPDDCVDQSTKFGMLSRQNLLRRKELVPLEAGSPKVIEKRR